MMFLAAVILIVAIVATVALSELCAPVLPPPTNFVVVGTALIGIGVGLAVILLMGSGWVFNWKLLLGEWSWGCFLGVVLGMYRRAFPSKRLKRRPY